MKFMVLSISALALLFAATSAHAAPPLPSGGASPTKIEGYCNEHGGTYMPPGPETSTYGCILPDGTIINCGGRISGCSVIEPTALLPTGELPLSIVNLKLAIDSKEEQRVIRGKLELLDLMITDLSILVEDKCGEPPVILE